MPLLLEQSDDVAELLRLQLEQHGEELHHVHSVESAVQHLRDCAHDAVLVGGEVAQHAWPWVFGAVPDGARVTLWSSHPGSRIPEAPEGRRIRTELLLGMPRLPTIVSRLLPHGRGQADESAA